MTAISDGALVAAAWALLVVFTLLSAATESRPRRTAVALSLVLGVAAAHMFLFRTLADDAFITFRYARNLAAGQGAVFNPGEYVEGYSNFLQLVLLAALRRFHGVDIVTGGQVLGTVAALALIPVTYVLARKATDGDGNLGILAALMVAASGSFVTYATSGLETSMYSLIIT